MHLVNVRYHPRICDVQKHLLITAVKLVENTVKGMKHLENEGKRSARNLESRKHVFSRCEISSQNLCCLKTSSNNSC